MKNVHTDRQTGSRAFSASLWRERSMSRCGEVGEEGADQSVRSNASQNTGMLCLNANHYRLKSKGCSLTCFVWDCGSELKCTFYGDGFNICLPLCLPHCLHACSLPDCHTLMFLFFSTGADCGGADSGGVSLGGGGRRGGCLRGWICWFCYHGTGALLGSGRDATELGSRGSLRREGSTLTHISAGRGCESFGGV